MSRPVIGQSAGSLPPIGRATAFLQCRLHGETWILLEPLEASKQVETYTRRAVVDISSAEMTGERS